MSKKLHISLESIEIAKPCRADWGAMRGDDRVRFCGTCQKNVYNLSALSREQAEELLNAEEALPCVRFYQRRMELFSPAIVPSMSRPHGRLGGLGRLDCSFF